MDSSRHYSPEEIIALSLALKNDQNSFKWIFSNAKELAALSEYITCGDDDALEWLKKNDYLSLVAFISALQEDDDAIEFLLKGPYKEWAAVANAVCNSDESAKVWLLKFGREAYVALIESLEALSGSSDSSRGFGGSGGGSSGGGGASGAW